MKNLYFEFLHEFGKAGLSSKKSISPFMEKNFKKPTATASEINKFVKENSEADMFIEDIRNTGHFDFERGEAGDIRPGRWYDVVNINARMTIAGMAYFDDYMANRQIKKNSNIQTMAICLTVLFTLGSLLFSGINYFTDNSKKSLNTQLIEQSQQIHMLQIELSKATNLLLLKKGAKNTLSKNAGG